MLKDYMRVFIAVEFNDKTKDSIASIRNRISEYSIAGNYTIKDNLHLTVKFIGQIEESNIQLIQDVMKDTVESIDPFTFIIDHMGRFVRKGKSLIWLGLADGIEELSMLHGAIDRNLSAHGYPRDKRDFTPHITLGRNVDLTLPFDRLKELVTIEPIPIYVDSLTLMESRRINGKLIYTPIYRCPLTQNRKDD